MTVETGKPTILVLASTYPRWRGDHEPGFVHELSKRLTERYKVVAVVPHAERALRRENLDGVEVRRFRYAPDRFETLINNGGMMTNLRTQKWKYLLLPLFFVSQFLSAVKVLLLERPALIHAHWLLPQGLIALVLHLVSFGRCRFIVTSHGADLFALRSRPFRLLKRIVCRYASKVTVVSEVMKNELANLFVDEKSIVVESMGVDLRNTFTPSAHAVTNPREALFVGRLVEKKGLEYLIKALPALLEIYPDIKLSVVGFGPEEPKLRMLADKLGVAGCVSFLGPKRQSELPEIYQRAAVFVAPFVQAENGDQEGLGLVLVEAMGCGCPVVVSDMPAVSDLKKFTNVHPVAQRDVDGLVRAVTLVLSSQGQTSRKVDEKLFEKYDWDHVAGRYIDIMSRAISEG